MWRRVLGCVLVVALVTRGLAFALASGAPAGGAIDWNWPGFELCQHGADSTAVPPGDLPLGHSDRDAHCIFCVAAAQHAFAAPVFSLQSVPPTAEQLGRSFIELHLYPDSAGDPSARPRGPPLTV